MSVTLRHHPMSSRIRRMRRIEAARPRDPDELHRLVSHALGMRMGRSAMTEGHDGPFDYLVHTFFEGAHHAQRESGGQDIVVWANRGGGKTMLGAVATLLDMVFKPGIQVRILAGSFEQSRRMYDYLLRLFHHRLFRGVIAREPTQRRIDLVNGSGVELLCQSHRSVRGQRVHKLRCDEVELFKSDIWQAAQLVTRSERLGPFSVRGAVEALSTMHRPFGLMSRLIDGRGDGDAPPARVMKWNAFDVIERCPPTRVCDSCELWTWCHGRAKEADGYMAIDDLIAQRRRTSDATWDAEMMCLTPRREHTVYANFDPAVGGRHVRGTMVEKGSLSGTVGLYGSGEPVVVGGVDFGLRNPFVFLWARLHVPDDPVQRGLRDQWRIEIIDEYVQRGRTMDDHIQAIASRPWPKPVWIGADPAGGQRSSQSGISDIQCLRREHYKVLAPRAGVRSSIDIVRRRLDQGTLTIDPRCRFLIESLASYHYDELDDASEQPVKDGPDHACDALRYLVLALEHGPGKVRRASYF